MATPTPNSFDQNDNIYSRTPKTRLHNFQLSNGTRLVNKHDAAAILGICPATLNKYRLRKNSTLIEGIHYHVWNSRVVRYNPVLLADWGINRNNPKAHQRAIEAYQATLPSSQPVKRGRKVRQ